MSLELYEKWETVGIYGLWRTSIVMFNYTFFFFNFQREEFDKNGK
jgi:hypothetical protein